MNTIFVSRARWKKLVMLDARNLKGLVQQYSLASPNINPEGIWQDPCQNFGLHFVCRTERNLGGNPILASCFQSISWLFMSKALLCSMKNIWIYLPCFLLFSSSYYRTKISVVDMEFQKLYWRGGKFHGCCCQPSSSRGQQCWHPSSPVRQ